VTLDRVALVTLRPVGVVGAAASVNSARIRVSGPTENVQVVCVREHTPFQPPKAEPSLRWAVSVIRLPYLYSAEH